jgi:hypothetical protein
MQMQAARNVYNAFHAYTSQDETKRGEWMGRNESAAKIINLVWELSGVFGDIDEAANDTDSVGVQTTNLPPDLPPEALAAIEKRKRQYDE